ncbi:hypothetical protein CHS0354_003943, partial [Potamilus streckersoni]
VRKTSNIRTDALKGVSYAPLNGYYLSTDTYTSFRKTAKRYEIRLDPNKKKTVPNRKTLVNGFTLISLHIN